MKRTLITCVFAAVAIAGLAQEPQNGPATKPADVEETIRRHWRAEYKKRPDGRYSYPAIDFGDLQVGHVGLVKSGRDVQMRYGERLDTGDHLVFVTRTVYGSVLSTGLQGAPTIEQGSRADYLLRTGGDRFPVGTKTEPVLIEGQLPADYRAGERIPVNYGMVVTDRVRIPGHGPSYRLRIVELPPLPGHRAEIGIDVRTWTDRSGEFSAEATLEKYESLAVTLVKTDGEAITVPMKQLSDADRRYVRRWIQQRRDREQERGDTADARR